MSTAPAFDGTGPTPGGMELAGRVALITGGGQGIGRRRLRLGRAPRRWRDGANGGGSPCSGCALPGAPRGVRRR